MKFFFRFFFPFIVLITTGIYTRAQGLIKAWDNVYSGNSTEGFTRLIETSDHGLVVAGNSNSGIGGDKTKDNHDTSYITFDFWIVKTDSNGILQWENSFGGNAHEELIDIKETYDHGFVLAGTTMSDSSGDVSEPTRGAGYKDYWMVKTDALGNKQWDKRFGGNYVDLLTCITQTGDGGYLLGGSSLSPASGDKSVDNYNPSFLNYDFWIVKTDSAGNKLWDKTIGGYDYDNMQAVLSIPGGGLLLGGYSKSGIGGDKSGSSRGLADFWIVKTNDSGVVVWDKTFGGDNTDWLFSMTLSNDGGFAIAGTSASTDSVGDKTVPSRGGWDYWVVKTDSSGNKLWDNAFGGLDFEELTHIEQTHDGGYLISGDSYSNISGDKTEDNLGAEQCWMVKTNDTGTYEWDKTVFTTNHDEEGYAIQTYEGCYVSGVYTEADTGGYKSHHNLYASDYWIVKFCYETPIVNFYSSDTVFCEKKYVSFFDMSTNNPTAWNWSFPGAVPSTSTIQNPVNIYYNAYGIFDVSLTATNAFGSGTLYVADFIYEILLLPPTVTVSGDTLFCSTAYSYQWFLDTVAILNATGNFYVMTVPGSYSVRITDGLGCASTSVLFTTGMYNPDFNTAISVAPNPSDGNFSFYTNLNKNSKFKMDIFSLDGSVVYSKPVSLPVGMTTLPVSMDKPAPGVYFLKIQSGTFVYRCKLLIK